MGKWRGLGKRREREGGRVRGGVGKHEGGEGVWARGAEERGVWVRGGGERGGGEGALVKLAVKHFMMKLVPKRYGTAAKQSREILKALKGGDWKAFGGAKKRKKRATEKGESKTRGDATKNGV